MDENILHYCLESSRPIRAITDDILHQRINERENQTRKTNKQTKTNKETLVDHRPLTAPRRIRIRKQELRATMHSIPNPSCSVLQAPATFWGSPAFRWGCTNHPSPWAVEHDGSQSKCGFVWMWMYCHIFTSQAISTVRILHLVCRPSGNRQATLIVLILTLQRLHTPECRRHNLQQW